MTQTMPALTASTYTSTCFMDDEKESGSSSTLQGFREKLSAFLTRGITSQDIVEEICKIAPASLKLGDIVDLVFEECADYEIRRVVNAFIFEKNYVLSPLNIVRKAILEDNDPAGSYITNDSLKNLLEKNKLGRDKKALASCEKFAYRVKHRSIYSVAKTAVAVSEYTLNFLWINLNPQDRTKDSAEHIFEGGTSPYENAECIKDPASLRKLEQTNWSFDGKGEAEWRGVKKSFLYRLSKWADLHPKAEMNLWYDSALVTEKAYKNTLEMLKAISLSRGVDLKLRDIRLLPKVEMKGEIQNVFHPGTQIYFRVDLSKVLVIDQMMSDPKSPHYTVFSDIDVKPMAPESLFDGRTMDYLAEKGYVANRIATLGDFENSFFIFDRRKKDLQKIHEKTLIEPVKAMIGDLRKFDIGKLTPKNLLSAEYVYGLYNNFLREMGEKPDLKGSSLLLNPRKIVTCPPSQFSWAPHFSRSDFRSETFRFIGKSDVPYTRDGRNTSDKEAKIESLKKWKAKPMIASSL